MSLPKGAVLPDPQKGLPVRRQRNVNALNGLRSSLLTQFVYPPPTGAQAPTYTEGEVPQSDSGIQITVSEGHPWPSKGRKTPGKLADIGGNFFTQKKYIESVVPIRVVGDTTYPFTGRTDITRNTTYKGPVIPNVVSTDVNGKRSLVFPPSFETSDKELENKWGATAISRCKPTNSVADVSTFLGELVKDGLPSLIGSTLWKDKAKASRKAGSEYLNVQFGWRPLISDVNKFLDGVRKADTVLRQYERDSGRVVRRDFAFPEQTWIEETTSKGTHIAAYAVPGSGGVPQKLDSRTELTKRREFTQRKWFSGAFTYYLPSGYDSRSKLSRYALLADRLGLTLTPETLWELAPWSWAVDWFSNAGDVVSNVSAFEQGGLILHYGYIMEHTVVRDTYSIKNAYQHSGKPLGFDVVTLVTETKKRRGANPYGFGVSWDGLSSFQISILTALGLTKGRR